MRIFLNRSWGQDENDDTYDYDNDLVDAIGEALLGPEPSSGPGPSPTGLGGITGCESGALDLDDVEVAPATVSAAVDFAVGRCRSVARSP